MNFQELDRRQLLFTSLATVPVFETAAMAQAGEIPGSRGMIDPREFGALMDGVHDDSTALQAAVDAALATRVPRPIIIPGICRIEKPVMIDRPVDQGMGTLTLHGFNTGRVVAHTKTPLFDTRLVDPITPKSEFVHFDAIRFEAPSAFSEASVLSDGFLRVAFNGCHFVGIAALRGRKYAQEWQFSRCIAQKWSGSFFLSKGGYRIVSTAGKYQNGGGHVFDIKDESGEAGFVGSSFHQDVVESNTGSFVRSGFARGISVSGLYAEGNHGPTLNFESKGINRGISVTGSMFAPKEEHIRQRDFFDLRWGRIQGGHVGGNYCSGRLHLTRLGPPIVLDVTRDHAEIELLRQVA